VIPRAGKEEDVAREVARLFDLDRPACLALWRARNGEEVPKHLSLLLMQRILAYDLQVDAFGGLPNKTRRTLRAEKSGAASGRGGRIAPGARLVREWNGRTYEVEVLVDGFAWKGRRFRSLSAIAREITGTRWSGPRFFGVGS
jgi:hypothetical protein